MTVGDSGRFVETSLPGDAGRDAPTARPQRGKPMNVASMEVLPITNTIFQCTEPFGNDPVSELEIGNTGTGTISIMATLNGRCQPSGSLSGAGGVGGLLAVAVTDCVATNSAFCILHSALYFPTYDANGNITAYVSETGEVVAQYAYDGFGRTLSATGPLASTFRHRFSTKYLDDETGFYYYGHRYYAPELMRWTTRDPIEEEGGLNLYSFCGNDGVNYFDSLGMWTLTIISKATTNDDEALWRAYDKTSLIIASIRSLEEMLTIMEREVELHGGSKITTLNLSGHGISGFSGVQFPKRPNFEFSTLSPEVKKRIKNVMGVNATITLWTCSSAQTKVQCDNLQKASNELFVTINAKTSPVGSGPDVGTGFEDFFHSIKAFFTKDDTNTWKRFTPQENSEPDKMKDGPEARILYIWRIK